LDKSEKFALEGPLAPPMVNGELAFDEPWQGRVFGMAYTLCENGCYEWPEFQASLIAAIAQHSAPDGSEDAYYDRFQEALEALLLAKGLTRTQQVDARAEAYAQRAHGHDH